jgi:hypothetical protein
VNRNLIIGTGVGASFVGDGTFNQNGGAVTVGSELRIGLSGGTGRYNLAGGTLNAPTIVLNSGGTFTYAGGAINTASVQLSGAARMTLSPGQNKTLKTAWLTIALGSELDLGDNRLVLNDTAGPGSWNGSSYTGVSGLVDAGRGNASNAQWDGSGIVTTDTRAVNNGDLVSIGVAKVGDFRGIADAASTTFGGQTVLGSDTVAMVTWGGDANLDGKINIDDYGQIDFNVGNSGSVFGWYNGDFNYDGKIDIDDYGIIDFNVAAQGGPLLSASPVEPLVAVPEPAAGLIAAALVAASRIRRRRR